jgi:hypothetical protein
MGLHGLMQLIGHLTGNVPFIIDLLQASAWIMLPLYVLFAKALTNFSRLARKNIHYLRWGCALFMAAWMIPSDNLQVFRHMLYRTSSLFMEESARPMRLQVLEDRRREELELAAAARWARNNTDRSAVFLTEEILFRAMSWRSMYVSRADVRHLYYFSRDLLEEWRSRIQQQYEWLHVPIEPQKLARDVESLARTKDYSGVREWYVIFPAHVFKTDPGPLEEITSKSWGDYFRVFRIPVENNGQ